MSKRVCSAHFTLGAEVYIRTARCSRRIYYIRITKFPGDFRQRDSRRVGGYVAV